MGNISSFRTPVHIFFQKIRSSTVNSETKQCATNEFAKCRPRAEYKLQICFIVVNNMFKAHNADQNHPYSLSAPSYPVFQFDRVPLGTQD